MTRQDVLAEMHRILQSHDAALTSIRAAHAAITQYLKAQDEVVLNTIEANRSAMRLLNRVMDEGLTN